MIVYIKDSSSLWPLSYIYIYIYIYICLFDGDTRYIYRPN